MPRVTPIRRGREGYRTTSEPLKNKDGPIRKEKKGGCSQFLQKELKILTNEVTHILKGDRPLPDYLKICEKPELWDCSSKRDKEIKSIYLRTRWLSLRHKCALTEELKDEKINRRSYLGWQKRYEGLQLKPDTLLSSLGEKELSVRAVELDRQFRAVGPDKFSCQEFRTVIENIQAIMEYEIRKSDCYAQDELRAFKGILQTFLSSNHELPYWQVHAYCVHFITLMEEYESGIDNSNEQRERRKALGFINKLNFIECIKKESMFFTEESRKWGIHCKSSPPATYRLVENSKTRLIWPSFEQLDASFFENCARYNIAPLGILLTRWAFHDGILFDRSLFHWHDQFHLDQLGEVVDDPNRKQAVLKTRNMLLEEVTKDPAITDTVKKLGFVRVHEEARSLLESDNEYYKTAKSFAFSLHHYDDLPVNLNVRHIQAACKIMETIEPLLPKTKTG